MAIDLENTILNFLDLETTGFSAKSDRIIEVYVSKVQNGRILDEFHSLVNPRLAIPREIAFLTAIPVSDLQFAPNFNEISTKLMSFLEDNIVIAHNARFDIGFLRNEFARVGIVFRNNYCCTVKISRFLYPQYKRHGLSHIINRLEVDEDSITSKSYRHRADYDTEVVRIFFYKSLQKFGRDKFTEAVNKALKTKALPNKMLSSGNINSKFDFDNIPTKPGVYIFYGENTIPLYVGMSNNLKRRVYDHLYSTTTIEKDFDIVNQVKTIKIIETAGVLGAKLRESHLIKTLLPIYNKKLRKKSKDCRYSISTNKDGFYVIKPKKLVDISVSDVDKVIDLPGGDRFVKLMLNEYIKKYGLCSKLLGLEPSSKKNEGKPCFYYHLNQCKGACIKKFSIKEYNKKFKEAFSEFLIKKWSHNGQIEVTEKSDTQEETFYIDNWCLLGSSKDDLPKVEKSKAVFDRDVYKILKSSII